jgi:hypothetical protein
MYQTFAQMPDELKGQPFLGFSPQTPPAEAAAAFERRHGRAPQAVVTARTNLLVGPLPQPEPRQLALLEAAA